MFGKIKSVVKSTLYYIIEYESGAEARLSILNDHVFRFHLDPSGIFLEHPKPHDEIHIAKIMAKSMEEYGTEEFNKSTLVEDDIKILVETKSISIYFERSSGLMSVINKNDEKIVLKEVKPLSIANGKSTQTLHQDNHEYYFGGGSQNGRFSHKGEVINIVNSNQWEDGGVASPNPFYWSTKGYGGVRNTWAAGMYDFGSKEHDLAVISHDSIDFDAFYFINAKPVGILQDYFELTGKPILMPEYAFYQSHFNAYNRDYWVEVTEGNDDNSEGIKFEDGKLYKEFQPKDIGNSQGILESLNGEKGNYQFSARAVIERYKKNDMPLGWFIPNDGYGAGYGQSETLDGDIDNLKEFADYCRANGVQVGLWTESNLHPKDFSSPKKGERDITKEVEKAGIVALKTDVVWVGSGYSFGLNGIEDASTIFVNRTKGSIRPMIVTVDGWAGTQRHSAVWTGDQTGGNWENIRFHIPTIIGTSLSGQPNVGADMDGIFGGQNKEVNIREFQWKAFIPIQMNMDGWGWNPKTPFQFDQEATDINRAYLKMKSTMMPYNYSIGFEAVNGLPMIRSMTLEFPLENPAYTKDSQYQYMWGPSLLIAPIYNGNTDESGNSVRDGLYLPGSQQIWIDFLTGDRYQGGHIINNLKVPLWKLPIFIKDGAIIPITNPNNNPGEIKRDQRLFLIYPNSESNFNLYEDDGLSTHYLKGNYSLTKIKCLGPKSNQAGNFKITIYKTEGSYNGFITNKQTILNIMTSKEPESVKLMVNGEKIPMKKAVSKNDFNNSGNAYFIDEQFMISKYLSQASHQKLTQKFILIKVDKIDISKNEMVVDIYGYANKGNVMFSNIEIIGDLQTPKRIVVSDNEDIPHSLKLKWSKVVNARSYDVERDGTVFRNIKMESATFENLSHLNSHKFRVRSVNDKGVSEWSSEVTGVAKNPFKNMIEGVRSICNIPDQNCQELKNLTVNNNEIWHTNWGKGTADPTNDKHITLTFDLGDVYQLEKMEYSPRSDAGNGTILKLQYRTSQDNKFWTDYSEIIEWERNSTPKTIFTNNNVRYVEVKVIQSVGNFGSGRKMLFFKKEETN